MEWIYMRHPETNGVAQFPADVKEGWEARGWEQCEAPPEDDVLSDAPAGVGQPDSEPVPKDSVSKPAKSTAKDKKENADG